MKGFTRDNPLLSLCGLNCGLCPMHIGGHCGGCGFGNQSCPLARCSLEHGGIEYCFQCSKYPCERYDGIDDYDSFITHQRQKADLHKAQQGGIENYNTEQNKKVALLVAMLERYNDGKRKSLFCQAVNLLELEDLLLIFDKTENESQGMPIRERAIHLSFLLQQCALERDVDLKLRKKGGK